MAGSSTGNGPTPSMKILDYLHSLRFLTNLGKDVEDLLQLNQQLDQLLQDSKKRETIAQNENSQLKEANAKLQMQLQASNDENKALKILASQLQTQKVKERDTKTAPSKPTDILKDGMDFVSKFLDRANNQNESQLSATFKQKLSVKLMQNAKPRLHGKLVPFVNKCRCEAKFRTSALLEDHLDVKIRGKFICDFLGCDLSFNTSIEAKRHKITAHDGHKPYPCRGCGQFFETEGVLKNHRGRWNKNCKLKRIHKESVYLSQPQRGEKNE